MPVIFSPMPVKKKSSATQSSKSTIVSHNKDNVALEDSVGEEREDSATLSSKDRAKAKKDFLRKNLELERELLRVANGDNFSHPPSKDYT